MAIGHFETLKRDIAAMLHLPQVCADDGQTLPDGMDGVTLLFDDVSVILSHASRLRSDRAFVFCDFGALPPERELDGLRRLMEMNFIFYQGNAPAFARDPASGHIVFCCEMLFAFVTAQSVLDAMRQIAQQAVLWRRSFFLDDMAVDIPGHALKV